jgi:hypothetical protein
MKRTGPSCCTTRGHSAEPTPRPLRRDFGPWWCFTWNRKAVHRSPGERVCSPPYRKRGRVLRSSQEEEVQIGKDARTTHGSSCSVAMFRTRRDVPSGPICAAAALQRLQSVPLAAAPGVHRSGRLTPPSFLSYSPSRLRRGTDSGYVAGAAAEGSDRRQNYGPARRRPDKFTCCVLLGSVIGHPSDAGTSASSPSNWRPKPHGRSSLKAPTGTSCLPQLG